MSVFVNRMHDGVNRSKAAQSFQSHNGCNAPVLRHGEGYYRVHRLGKEQIPWACTDSSPFPRGNGAVQPDPLREGVVPQARETTKEKSAKARSATRLFSPLAPRPSPLAPRPRLYRSYRAFDRSFHGPCVRNPSVMTYPPYGGFA